MKEKEEQILEAGQPHVAYVLLWFPLFTQPFIFREVQCLRKIMPVEVYTLYGKNLRHCSTEMREAGIPVHTFGVKTVFSVCGAVIREFCKKPRLMWRLFLTCCCRRWPNLEIFGENLWAFCVGASLGKSFREDGIDLVYAPWPRGTATAAMVGASLAGVPYAIAARGDNLEPADPDLGDKIANAIFIRANNAADKGRIENFAGNSGLGKTELVYNSLTLPKASGPVGRFESDVIRLLALGRFDVTKGFDDLLKACAILKQNGMKFHLTLAGGGGKVMGLGNLEDELRGLRKNLNLEAEVSMPGLVSHDELPNILNQHDIFVAPCVVHSSGRRDGIPNTVIEAMAYGLPVVSTNVNALPEIVRNGETGISVEPNNPQALADAIIELASCPDKARTLGSRASEFADNLFDCQANAKRMADIFKKYADRRIMDLKKEKSCAE